MSSSPQTSSQSNPPVEFRRLPWQFTLRGLLLFTAAAAVYLAIIRQAEITGWITLISMVLATLIWGSLHVVARKWPSSQSSFVNSLVACYETLGILLMMFTVMAAFCLHAVALVEAFSRFFRR